MPAVPSPFDHDAALAACARGERFALKAVYEYESRWLLAVAMRIVRNRAAAEDVLQDAFLRVWQRAASFDPRLGSGRGWIYTVVRHCALDHARRASREQPLDDEALEPLLQAHAGGDRESPFDARSQERCLGKLDEQRRLCIEHAFHDGYTHEQIAARLQAPPGTVKSWIWRGLQSLKECLG